MSKPTPGRGAKARAFTKGLANHFLWMVVLGVVLGLSGYSLYFVARHLGVPWYFAAAMSTAFDGTALIMAQQELKATKERMPSNSARAGVFFFAGLSSWLNGLHAVLGHENLLITPLWAGLPIAAAWLFENHTMFERRRALALAGLIYPSSRPKVTLGERIGVGFGEVWQAMRKLDRKRFHAKLAHNEGLIDRGMHGMPPAPRSAPAIPGVVETVLDSSPGKYRSVPAPKAPVSASGADISAPGESAYAAGSASPESAPEPPAGTAPPGAESGSAPDTEAPPDGADYGAECEALSEAFTEEEAPRQLGAVHECENPSCNITWIGGRPNKKHCSKRCRNAASRARTG